LGSVASLRERQQHAAVHCVASNLDVRSALRKEHRGFLPARLLRLLQRFPHRIVVGRWHAEYDFRGHARRSEARRTQGVPAGAVRGAMLQSSVMHDRALREVAPPRLLGVGFYLVSLVLLAVVPLLLAAGVLVDRQQQLQRRAFTASLLQTAHALSVAVDRQLESYRVMLETLAESDELKRGDFDGFHAIAERVAARHGAIFISLFNASGDQVFNSLARPGQLLPTPFSDPRSAPAERERPPVGDPAPLRTVLATGRPVVSNLLFGLVAQRLIFTVNIPIMRGGKVAYVLNAAFDPSVMSRSLKDNPEFADVPAVIFDGNGFIVSRWRDAEHHVGKRTSLWSSNAELAAAQSGVGIGRTLEGLEVYFSHARSQVTGWGVDVGALRDDVEGSLNTNSRIGAAVAGGGLVFGLLLALGLASRLRRSIAALAASADRSEAPPPAELQVREIVQLQHALTTAAMAREARMRERERLLVAQTREAEAVEASRMKDHFIAVLSHELRNPLAPIRSGIWMLRNKNVDASAIARIVEMLDRHSLHLVRLVNDLLDVSRIRSGKVTLVQERVDLCVVARQAIEAAVPALDARRHRLVTHLPDTPVEVIGDFGRLSQVLSNLLDNASKYTPNGGDIRLSVAVHEGDAIVTVADSGRGISADSIAGIFTGVRGERHGGRGGTDGLGLGLPLAKALVDAHNGTLHVESGGDGKGSTFTLRLPLAVSAPESLQSLPLQVSKADASKVPGRVLIVDDNVDAAVTLQDSLDALGHDTAVAHDGASALAAVATFAPDIVLLDIGLPDVDGYEVARRLRAAIQRPIQIVALTGWGQDSDRRKSHEAGIDHHLVKPVRMGDLITLISRPIPDEH
jgi:signal transduction histidine kinase/ActR/RegA family two-component response regulator